MNRIIRVLLISMVALGSLKAYANSIAIGPNAAADDGFWSQLHVRIEGLLKGE